MMRPMFVTTMTTTMSMLMREMPRGAAVVRAG
jgi:hypothetical protein